MTAHAATPTQPSTYGSDSGRARLPDASGFAVSSDGVRLAYDVYGTGEPTIAFLPSTPIVHARQWKAQIPYLSRHFRVVAYDGRGNGRSDRPVAPESYADPLLVDDVLAVLDASDTPRALLVGLCGDGHVQGGVYLGGVVDGGFGRRGDDRHDGGRADRRHTRPGRGPADAEEVDVSAGQHRHRLVRVGRGVRRVHLRPGPDERPGRRVNPDDRRGDPDRHGARRSPVEDLPAEGLHGPGGELSVELLQQMAEWRWE